VKSIAFAQPVTPSLSNPIKHVLLALRDKMLPDTMASSEEVLLLRDVDVMLQRSPGFLP
jgi:hypothetical protein